MDSDKGTLILTRQVNQQIVIADGEVVLTIKRIHGNRVSIALTADRDLKIMRGEVVSLPVKRKIAEAVAS